MADQSYINVLNKRGKVVKTKARADIDRVRDILPCVYVFVAPARDTVLVATIPDDAYGSRGTYVGKLGFPVASFIRADEDALEAAKRAVKKDLGVEAGDLHILMQGYVAFADGLRRHATVYLLSHKGPFVPDVHAASKLETIALPELRSMVMAEPKRFAYSFIEFLPLLSL